jgi:eukaryotic-like serine/threonine-protein kinase
MDRNELNGPDWHRVSRILDEVLAVPEADRAALLERACGGDAELLARLTRMVAAAGSDAFEMPAGELAADLIDGSVHEGPSAMTGQRIGAYQIERVLGVGGMGVVYLARRADGHFEQRVALKLIRAASSDPVSMQRFASERQILADLDHPNLSRLLDGGLTDDGWPYFVMEYVDGVPITQYCDEHKLDLNERLTLFETVCGVVDHAHRNLIIHRDLKPTNILVTSDGTPKLLDFGIAKLLDPTRALDRAVTAADSSPLTPEYSSPEQIRARPVTTESDVYSLGVLLYTLLTHKQPYTLAGLSAGERERVVCEETPAAPSDVVDGAESRKRLRGDLDSIVMMALRKEPQRRYSSAREFARDIARHRAHQTVAARPDSVGYRVNRFFRRNRMMVAAAAVVMSALIVGLGVALWQARVASRERDQAKAEADKRQAVSDALLDIIALANPGDSPVDVAAGKQVLDYAVSRVDTQFAGQPDMLAKVLIGIGEGYGRMGSWKSSQQVLQRAQRLARATFGPRSLEEANALEALGNSFIHTSDFARADSLIHECVSIRLEHFKDDDPIFLQNYSALGTIATRQERHEDAERYHQKALDMRLAEVGPDHPYTAICYNNLATAQSALGKMDEAEANYRRSIAIWEKQGTRNTDLAEGYHNLAIFLEALGRARESADYNRKALAVYRELGLEGSRYANFLNTLANGLNDTGEFAEAESVARESLAMNIKNLGEHNIQVAANHLTLSRALVGQGRYDEALEHARAGYATFQSVLGNDHLYTAAARSYVGDAEWRSGHMARGRATLESALQIQLDGGKGTGWRASQTLFWLAQADIQVGDARSAEPRLRRAIELRLNRHPPDSWAIAEIQAVLGDCLIRLGRPEEARDLLSTAVANLTRTVGADDARTRAGKSLLASISPR